MAENQLIFQILTECKQRGFYAPLGNSEPKDRKSAVTKAVAQNYLTEEKPYRFILTKIGFKVLRNGSISRYNFNRNLGLITTKSIPWIAIAITIFLGTVYIPKCTYFSEHKSTGKPADQKENHMSQPKDSSETILLNTLSKNKENSSKKSIHNYSILRINNQLVE